MVTVYGGKTSSGEIRRRLAQQRAGERLRGSKMYAERGDTEQAARLRQAAYEIQQQAALAEQESAYYQKKAEQEKIIAQQEQIKKEQFIAQERARPVSFTEAAVGTAEAVSSGGIPDKSIILGVTREGVSYVEVKPKTKLQKAYESYLAAEEYVSEKTTKRILPKPEKIFMTREQARESAGMLYEYYAPQSLKMVFPSGKNIAMTTQEIFVGGSKGMYTGIREKPLKIAAIGTAAALTGGVGGVVGGVATKVLPTAFVTDVGTILGVGVTGYYGYTVAKRVSEQPAVYEASAKAGEILTTEIAPVLFGSMAYKYVKQPVLKIEKVPVGERKLEVTYLSRQGEVTTKNLPFGKIRNIKNIISVEGKRIVFTKAELLKEIRVPGQRTIVTTKFRELLGFEPVYKGYPYGKGYFMGYGQESYHEAYRRLIQFGYTKYGATQSLRFHKPYYALESVKIKGMQIGTQGYYSGIQRIIPIQRTIRLDSLKTIQSKGGYEQFISYKSKTVGMLETKSGKQLALYLTKKEISYPTYLFKDTGKSAAFKWSLPKKSEYYLQVGISKRAGSSLTSPFVIKKGGVPSLFIEQIKPYKIYKTRDIFFKLTEMGKISKGYKPYQEFGTSALLRKPGKTIDLRIVGEPIIDKGKVIGRVFGGIGTDVTSRLRTIQTTTGYPLNEFIKEPVRILPFYSPLTTIPRTVSFVQVVSVTSQGTNLFPVVSALSPFTMIKPLQALQIKQLPIEIPREIPREIPITTTKAKTIPVTIPITITESAPIIEPVRVVPPPMLKILIPKKKKPEEIFEFPITWGKPGKIKPSKSYSVSVKRFGKFKTVGVFPSLRQAFQVGKGKVSRTLAATFKVGGIGKIGTPRGFYSKILKGERLFIEKPKYRLSTPSEKAEIKLFKKTKKRKRR